MVLSYILYSNESSFGDMYPSYTGCSYANRLYPEGHVPASVQLNLNSSEKKNLQNFIKNSSQFKDMSS